MSIPKRRGSPDTTVKVKCNGCNLKFVINLISTEHPQNESVQITRPCPYCEEQNTYSITITKSLKTTYRSVLTATLDAGGGSE